MAGCRVLVVEDETLIAVLIEDVLADGLRAALQTAKEDTFDNALTRYYDPEWQGISGGWLGEYLFSSPAAGDWSLPPSLRDQRRLTKPFTMTELEEQIRLLFAEAVRSHASS